MLMTHKLCKRNWQQLAYTILEMLSLCSGLFSSPPPPSPKDLYQCPRGRRRCSSRGNIRKWDSAKVLDAINKVFDSSRVIDMAKTPYVSLYSWQLSSWVCVWCYTPAGISSQLTDSLFPSSQLCPWVLCNAAQSTDTTQQEHRG